MKPPKPSEIVKFYGNPDINKDGIPDRKWEDENLTYIVPPYKMIWSWGPECRRIRVHKKCAESLLICLEDISYVFNERDRMYYQLDRNGGVYNFRAVRGGKSLSMHSYGAAIDLAPELNPLGERWVDGGRMIPDEAIKIFTTHGWFWGGQFRRPDCQHFQYTDGA